MIKKYNRRQILKAIFYAVMGGFCCWLSYLFFRHLSALIFWQLKLSLSKIVPIAIGLMGLAATWVSGYRVWKQKGGLFGYHESGLYHDFGEDTAGAVLADFYMHRITGPAYILGQIFMAGPLWLLKSLTLGKSIIPYSSQLESKLVETLKQLRSARQWQGLNDYPDSRVELLYLAQMGLIDFSARKGTPRFKAN